MKSDLFDRITFLLVQPESPGNVGSAARAIKNMGFSRLAIVSPSDPRRPEAIRMAYRSGDVLNAAPLYPDLPSALADAQWVVGLTGRKRKGGGDIESIENLAPEILGQAVRNRVALLFGPEGTGLTNEILSRCHRRAFIPTGGVFSSLNLAQSVLMVASALFRSAPGQTAAGPPRVLAVYQETTPLFEEMDFTLERIGFLKGPARKEMTRRLKNLFTRAGLDGHEAKILRALFRQVLWASEEKEKAPRAGHKTPDSR
ncbi:MAG TPA: RNA methyltransferase [Candidatus Manganitrophaceae bacterium]|nr:RNA methyltransferase [Candidatus Manganitrophaceae bacterium]